MQDQIGAGEGAKPTQLFKTYDVPVQDEKIVVALTPMDILNIRNKAVEEIKKDYGDN